jgi:hypothetical protein
MLPPKTMAWPLDPLTVPLLPAFAGAGIRLARRNVTRRGAAVVGNLAAMSQIALVVGAALLVYLALRVVQIKRPSLPFLIAYPAFVLIFAGGGVALFIGLSHAAARLGYGSEDPAAMVAIFGGTALGLLVLSWIARRAIG